jgi:hypothetical protein
VICRPIHTYGGKGATKEGIILSMHAPLVAEGATPTYALINQAFFVEAKSIRASFRADSLINFGKLYTVEDYCPIRYLGDLTASSKSNLETAVKEKCAF